jgi:hypothetical protein
MTYESGNFDAPTVRYQIGHRMAAPTDVWNSTGSDAGSVCQMPRSSRLCCACGLQLFGIYRHHVLAPNDEQ